jgi:hypothetical protein
MRRNTTMPRPVRLYTTAQVEEMTALVDRLAGQSGLLAADRRKLAEFQADLHQTVREDRRRAAGTSRLPAASS